MLADGLNSPFYKIIRAENSLSYFVSANLYGLGKSAIPCFNAATTFDNQEKLTNMFDDLIKNGADYLTEERLEQIIHNYKLFREEAEILRYKNASRLIKKGWGCLLPTNFDSITLEKVKETYKKYFN